MGDHQPAVRQEVWKKAAAHFDGNAAPASREEGESHPDGKCEEIGRSWLWKRQ